LLTRIAGRAARQAEISALDGVTMGVGPGEVCALVGHNGSGKSTLLRTLATLVLPDAGSASVDGCDVVAEDVEVRRRVSLVTADDRSFSMRLTGRENLEFFAGLYGTPVGALAGALEQVGLADAAADVYATYSSGMRQRLALARGLMTKPAVLLLDEPFRALDEASADALREAVAAAAGDGSTVLVATHHLDELAGLCQRVVQLEAGRVTYDGTAAGWRALPAHS
jgi:ABC-type multidrug transport system ATPase subunit